MRCPHCDSKEVVRSRRRNFFERNIVAMFMYLPFRCTACKHRFFRRQSIQLFPEGSKRRSVAMWLALLVVAITAFIAISVTTSRGPERSPQFKFNRGR
jgi:hypothetical protein